MRNDGFDSSSCNVVHSGFTSLLNRLFDDFGFVALKEFKEQAGHVSPLATHKTADGFALGSWCDKQRMRKGKLSSDRIQRLEAIGFVWDQQELKWENGFAALKEFKEQAGHASPPRSHKTADGFALGKWCDNQRTEYK